MAKDVITLFSRCLTLQLISCQSLGCSEELLGVLTSASCPGKNWCSEQRGPDHKPSLGSSHTHSTYRVLGMKINFSEWLSCTFVTRVSSEPKWCHLSRRYRHNTSGQKSRVIFPSADDQDDLFQAGEGVKPCRQCSCILQATGGDELSSFSISLHPCFKMQPAMAPFETLLSHV